MNSSRATLATTGILLSLLHACAEQTVVPTEPSRVAPLTSIPGSSSAVVRSGEEGERYVRSMATEWAAAGDHRLSQFLREQHQLTVRSNVRADARSTATAPSAPSLVIIEGDAAAESGDEFPSPSTAPSAEIFYSSTVPFVSGSSGVIVSSVTYFGNIATTEVKYSATASNGSTVIPESKVSNRGLGDNVPCMGSWL